jgi:mannosyltransferase OCH1-like enzyme
MIPKVMHFIWVGDETKCPTNCIDSWRAHNTGWHFVVWGNKELHELKWHNRDHIMAMQGQELKGVADLMRWEILFANGGVVIDADSVALRPLDDHLLECEAFASWENEIMRPGLIAPGTFGCQPGNPFIKQIVKDIHAELSVTHEMAWQTVGALRLTNSYRTYSYSQMRIYPSHYFMPEHFTGQTYQGSDPIYSNQLWGTTRSAYDRIHTLDLSAAAPRPSLAA